jgi:hypothetical protein
MAVLDELGKPPRALSSRSAGSLGASTGDVTPA